MAVIYRFKLLVEDCREAMAERLRLRQRLQQAPLRLDHLTLGLMWSLPKRSKSLEDRE